MENVLSKNIFIVKEHVGILKAANNYDVFDAESGNLLLECREENLGFFTKLFRFTKYKRYTPFNLEIKTPEGETLVVVKRGISLFLSKVEIFSGENELLGTLKQKLFSIGGAFKVLGDNDQEICELKGKWTGWDFKFISGDYEFAHISKTWAGIGKELFTSADNYVLKISEDVPEDDSARKLILGAVMCIDMVLKE